MEMVAIGRYVLFGEIASGGTASVHFGRVLGAAGFRRIVAVKRLHSELAKDPQFHAMLVDEARVAARVRHPNVVPIVDVVESANELCLVMDYVPGESLARLRKAVHERGTTVPAAIAAAIVVDVLRGLHAAHEARGPRGEALEIVHRDVSPQNILVGVDGLARVVDFGIAKAVGRLQTTRNGEVKGKAAYMAPEQLRGGEVDRRCDLFAVGIVLWELLCARRLFAADSPAASMMRVLERDPEAPSTLTAGISAEVDAVVLRALARDAAHRFESAEVMADALQAVIAPASSREVGAWVLEVAREALHARAAEIAVIEAEEPRIPEVPAASAPPSRERRTRRSAVVATILASALLAVVGLVFIRAKQDDVRAGREVTAAATATSAAPALSDGPPLPTPSEVTSSSVIAVPSARSDTATHGRPRTPSPRAAKSERCNPPYTVDPRGIHVMKADCL